MDVLWFLVFVKVLFSGFSMVFSGLFCELLVGVYKDFPGFSMGLFMGLCFFENLVLRTSGWILIGSL